MEMGLVAVVPSAMTPLQKTLGSGLDDGRHYHFPPRKKHPDIVNYDYQQCYT